MRTVSELSEDDIKEAIAAWASKKLVRQITPSEVELSTRDTTPDRQPAGYRSYSPVIKVSYDA